MGTSKLLRPSDASRSSASSSRDSHEMRSCVPGLKPGRGVAAPSDQDESEEGETGMDATELGQRAVPRGTDPLETNFGSEAPFALGVEEELLLVGPDGQLADRGRRVIRAADPEEGQVDGELFESMVESRSDVAVRVADAIGELAGL